MTALAPTGQVARVAPSEAAQLRILRATLGLGGVGVDALLRDTFLALPAMRPTAAALARETLRKRLPFELARRGGGRRARCVHEGITREGRLWERHAPLSLPISPATEAALRWMTASPLGAFEPPRVALDPPRLGDELWMLFAADLLVRHGCVAALPSLAPSRLVRLAFGALLPRTEAALSIDEPLVILLEALQPELARAWRLVEEHRRALRAPAAIVAIDAAAEATLDAFFAALPPDAPYLAAFLGEAAAPYVARDRAPAAWAPALSRSGPLAERAAALRAAGTLPRAALRLRALAAQSGATAFFDEGYASAQLLLSSLEPWREGGFRDAEALLARLASLDAVTASPLGEPS
ncbi:MAG: hypothetical protein KF901_21435 [Myxococcales bacterium]|nr:hypothetical protein [Myxococcales bacterium]